MAQWSIDLTAVAEPYFVPPRDDWVCDDNRSVALIRRSAADTLPFEAITRGRGYVAAVWGDIMVVGVYFAPSLSLADLESVTLELATVVRRGCPRPVILAIVRAKAQANDELVETLDLDPWGRPYLMGRAWVLALRELGPRLSGLLSACLERGQFPSRWKTGKLVLLRKEGRPADSPSAYRPIVLLDEVCKIFERVIASRLVQHMTRVGPDLAENQFGFRQGRSTVDAIMRVKTLAEEAVARGEVVLAVSLDIANAFNTLPWSTIREALRYHGVPRYLQRVVAAYLSNRAVVYP
ncbi:uncharacterized protein LOC124540917, partial [Vanessa cardui]|uniref:uncharacterized protein LOC124540917 n=1 Tax=Vanessa cardui TaxID=171605 RepID=UPI001F12A0C5